MVYASFPAHSGIRHCQQSGRKVNERNSSFVSGSHKTANVCDNASTKTDEQTMTISTKFRKDFPKLHGGVYVLALLSFLYFYNLKGRRSF